MTGFERAAWSWVDHLRHGGGTPWLDWVEAGTGTADVAVGPDPLPGAAELELVRRLAVRAPAHLPPQAFGRLAGVVLARSGPGRGLAQLPLLWPPAPAPARVGAPPVDPADVPDAELIRVGVGAMADLLLAPDTRVRGPRRARRRPWTRPFRLEGAPVTVAAVRAALRANGHVEGGRAPEVLLFAEPLDVHLAQVWTARVQRGVATRWDTFVARWAHRQELPPAARLAATARRWADRVGAERVHVLVAPGDAAAARRTASEVLGLRTAEKGHRAAPLDLSPAGTDVLRRLNAVLNVRVEPERRRPLLRRAAGLVAGPPGEPLVLPTKQRAWAEGTADRLAEALRAGGYAVHGDLDRLAVSHRDGAAQPTDRDVLDLVLGACLAEVDPSIPRGLEAR